MDRSERFAALNPPGSPNHIILLALIPISALLGAANLWLWRQLRQDRYTPRNWVIGLLLLIVLTVLFVPVGILCIINWCATTCKSLFYTRGKAPPAQPLQTSS